MIRLFRAGHIGSDCVRSAAPAAGASA